MAHRSLLSPVVCDLNSPYGRTLFTCQGDTVQRSSIFWRNYGKYREIESTLTMKTDWFSHIKHFLLVNNDVNTNKMATWKECKNLFLTQIVEQHDLNEWMTLAKNTHLFCLTCAWQVDCNDSKIFEFFCLYPMYYQNDSQFLVLYQFIKIFQINSLRSKVKRKKLTVYNWHRLIYTQRTPNYSQSHIHFALIKCYHCCNFRFDIFSYIVFFT